MMTGADPVRVADFLDRAGDERLVAKVRRLDDQLRHLANADMDQVFYQSLMMSLGSGAAKSLYYLLAKRAPLAELLDYSGELPESDRRIAIESLLLHVAGLVPSEEELGEAPGDSRDYASQIELIWKRFEPFWSDRRIAPTRRWYRSIRPVNFPCRRIAAIAELLARTQREGRKPLEQIESIITPWMRELEAAKPARKPHPVIKELCAWFEVEAPHSFWTTHYSFTAKPSARPMALLGESTARSLVFNAVLPAVALAAERTSNESLARAIHKIYAIFPPLQSNHITEFMTRRLFGDDRSASALVATERRQQAMFQIFHSCCNGEEKHCDSCYYFRSN